jgi:phosphopantothenoylcysteine decarboxylase/phosphopantothenate--cysteine ligase
VEPVDNAADDNALLALRGRRVVLCVTGGIAAYKAVEVCRRLVDAGAHVAPALTHDALRFVGALTFSALASEPARTSLFDGPEPIPHTRLGQTADLVVVAPATAKVIGKYAHGISDDLVTATLLATRAPVLVAPAMHTEMWEHPSVAANLATLRVRGVHIVDPEEGRLAGGDVGAGRLADPARIVAEAANVMARDGDLAGTRVVITAGGTREPIDPVRFIGNRSSGKMGYAIADAAAARGAAVTMIATVARPAHPRVEIQLVETAEEMAAAMLAAAPAADVIVMAAAVADFRPKVAAGTKLKKADGVPEITLEPTPDILKLLGRQKRPDQLLVGFAAETDDVRANAAAKLAAKQVDLMVGNDVRSDDSGFEVDTNRAVLLDAHGGVDEVGLLSKTALADTILDRVRDARPRPHSGGGSERRRATHGEGAST